MVGEIDDFSADFYLERGSHTQRVDDEREQKSAKKRDLNGQMEFRKKSIRALAQKVAEAILVRL